LLVLQLGLETRYIEYGQQQTLTLIKIGT